jgi:hypothetical protein
MSKPTLTTTEGVALTTHAKYGRKWYPPARIAALGNIAEADAGKALAKLVTLGLAVERMGRFALTDTGKAVAASWKPETPTAATPKAAAAAAAPKAAAATPKAPAKVRRPKAAPAPIEPPPSEDDEDDADDEDLDLDLDLDMQDALDEVWGSE